jgi:hypothetical protein
MFTGRNKISEHEVQALLTQTPPSDILSSFYVVMDRFCANYLNNVDRPFPPIVQFHFTDNNTVVPDLTARLTATPFESTTATANITQRITLEFSVHFASEQAFNGIAAGDERPGPLGPVQIRRPDLTTFGDFCKAVSWSCTLPTTKISMRTNASEQSLTLCFIFTDDNVNPASLKLCRRQQTFL